LKVTILILILSKARIIRPWKFWLRSDLYLFYVLYLKCVVAQCAHNHCHIVAVIALSFTRLLSSQPAATHIILCVIIIVTLYLFVLILICKCVFTMDAFKEVFNMLMILGEYRGNYRAAVQSKSPMNISFCCLKNRFLQYSVRSKRRR